MLLQGKKALIMGLANNRSIAYGIASSLKAQGARLAFNYVGDAIKKRVMPLSEELGGEFTFQCDVCDDAQIQAAADLVNNKWGDLDILVHSVAFANREDLAGRFVDTSRDGFRLALEVSAYSLT
ncbi:SDR family oxidoreductase, partial [uncultured Desulfovibrio sp.]